MASAECEIVQLIYSNECVCTYTVTCFAHLCTSIIPMEPQAIKIYAWRHVYTIHTRSLALHVCHYPL